MEQDYLISIIIPVYNVEKYLRKCLDSIINQTYKKLEIILIDDGSTDNSGKICEEYAKKDDRIIVIHKENAGVSSARNRGIELANGKYIGFIDSDDWIEENMYETLYQNLLQFDVDISMCNYSIIRNHKKTFHKHDLEDGILIDNKKEFFELLRLNYYKGFLWNKLFKSEIIKEMRMREPIYVCEDLLFIAEVATKCKNFYFDNQCLYNYLIRENSAITGKVNHKKVSVLEAYKNIILIVKEYSKETMTKYEFDFFRWKNDITRQLKDKKLEEENDLLYKKLMKSNIIKPKEKIEILLRYRMYGIYNFLRGVYNKIK